MTCPTCQSTNPFITFEVIGEKVWIDPTDPDYIHDSKGDSVEAVPDMPYVCAACGAAVTGPGAGAPAPEVIAKPAPAYFADIAFWIDQYAQFGEAALNEEIRTALTKLQGAA